MDNENSSYSPPSSPSSTGSNSMTWVVAVIVLLVLGVGGYFLYQNRQQNNVPAETNNTLNQTDSLNTQTIESTNGAQQASVKEFTVTGSSFKFDKPELRVNTGDTVKINYTSAGGIHDFMIDEFSGAKTRQLPSGQSQTIQFVADKAGSYEYYCSVGNHRQQGMKGTLIVE